MAPPFTSRQLDIQYAGLTPATLFEFSSELENFCAPAKNHKPIAGMAMTD
jgi:hypothetical protein